MYECDDWVSLAVNHRGKCPKCGSKLIDQETSEDCGTIVWYHCAKCGCWYNEEGEIDTELLAEN
jgi:predicted nucleic-acid-binding Zn-ribbon protein